MVRRIGGEAMKIYDISMKIHEDMMVYKNKPDKKPLIWVAHDYRDSSSYESRIDIDLHTGTHIDAPLHMIEEGATTDTIELDKMVTSCKVIDLTDVVGCIKKEDLVECGIEKNDFVLFKTKNSYDDSFNPEFIYLEKCGAAYLKEIGVKGVGIDSLGIERSQKEHETHKILFSAGVLILEGLRLKDIEPKNYILHALPLNIHHVEAAPVRAVLIDKEDFCSL